MALFKFGKSAAATGSEGGRARSRRKQAADPQETLEAIRRRAHYRLLGAALLVGVTVIGLPMLFDQQPRLVQVDAQVSIPDKGDVAPLHASSAETLDVREEFVQPKDEVMPEASVPMPDAPPQAAAPEPAPAPQPAKAAADARDKERKEQQAKAEKERQQQQARAKAEKERKEQQAKAEKERKEQQAKADKERKEQQAKADKERKEKEAKAKAEKERKEQQAKAEKERKDKEAAKTVQQQPQPQRFFIPLGSFPDAQAAHQARMKAERAGVHTYIQIIKNSAGEERTRVRAGPYNSRQDADKDAATLKGAGLSATVQPF